MIAKTCGRLLIVASALVALNSFADTIPAAKAKEMMSLKMMDTDKDGMVSKSEFVDMMGKLFDMQAKGSPGGMLDGKQLDSLWKALMAARR